MSYIPKRCKVFIGQTFNKLTALEYLRDEKTGRTNILCLCICGNKKVLPAAKLLQGIGYSCGCSTLEAMSLNRKEHGCSTHPLWEVYITMKKRCYNTSFIGYDYYGGRGITVCDRWLEDLPNGFNNFVSDIGERPVGTTLDRIDVNGNYEPLNCRWADKSTQSFNTRRYSTNTSGTTGVKRSENGLKWLAYISCNGEPIHLGTFETYDAAVNARREAELKYFGELKPEAREVESAI